MLSIAFPGSKGQAERRGGSFVSGILYPFGGYDQAVRRGGS